MRDKTQIVAMDTRMSKLNTYETAYKKFEPKLRLWKLQEERILEDYIDTVRVRLRDRAEEKEGNTLMYMSTELHFCKFLVNSNFDLETE